MSTLQEIKDDKKEEKENQKINMLVNFSLTPAGKGPISFAKFFSFSVPFIF